MNFKQDLHSSSLIIKQIPNLLTTLRLFLIIPISLLLLNQNYSWAVSLFLVAAISDGLDGFLAKKMNSVSTFGLIMDPIADKFLLVSIYIVLTYLGQIPVWLCVLIVVRDLSIIAAVTGYFFVGGSKIIKPSLVSKANTFIQFILILYLIVTSHFDFNSPIETILIGLVATTTIISGFDYAIRWIRLAYDNIQKSN